MDADTLSTKEIGVLGKKLVSTKLEEMGVATEIPKGNKNLVIAKPGNGNRSLAIRVKSRRSGDWQIPTTEGASPDEKVDAREFWVLVDFALHANEPDFYVMPGSWLRRKIFADYQDYLASHGGKRPVTPKSTHHKVLLDDVKKWKDRWDIIGLG